MMRIAQVAPPLESVPPRQYGGTERVVSTLTEELVRRGHDVTLFASADSHTSARLEAVVPEALWHQDRFTDFGPFWTITMGRLYRAMQRESFDVVHLHMDYIGFPIARALNCPALTTLHGRLDLPELGPLFAEFAEVPVVSVSDAQRKPVPFANWMATVYNGIDLHEYEFSAEPGQYLAFLGRISPEKGVDTAIRVARQAGMPLRIAARPPLPFKNNPEARRDWDYFEREVQPLLQGRQVEMMGQVGGAEKSDFLRNAAALLFPIRWPEPFGLVMPEALACGTPVLALRAGSVPEVLEDGATGFICDDEQQLVEAIGHLGEIDRARCRDEAMRRFSPQAMVNAYEQVYRRVRSQHGHDT